MVYIEQEALDNPSKALNDNITKATNIHNSALEGTEFGQYEPGSKDMLNQAIKTASGFSGSNNINDLIGAKENLDNAINAFEAKKVT